MILLQALNNKHYFAKNFVQKKLSSILSVILTIVLFFNGNAIAGDVIIDGVHVGDIRINSGQSLIFNSGEIRGTVIGGSGSVYNGQFIVNSDLNHYNSIENIDQLRISLDSTMSLRSSSSGFVNVAVRDTILGDGSELVLGGGTAFRSNNIDGSSNDTGTLTISGGMLLNSGQDIGVNNRLARMNIDSGSVFWVPNGELNVATVNINNGSLFTNKEINTDSVILNNDSSFKFFLLDGGEDLINADMNIAVASDSNTADLNLINFASTSKTVKFNGNIGASDKKLEDILIIGNAIADFSDAPAVYARSTKLSVLNYRQPEIILGLGIFDSEITLHDSQSGSGKVTIADDHNLISSIGKQDFRINDLEVKAGATLSVANTVYVNSITNNSGSTFRILENDSGSLHSVDASNFTNYGSFDSSAASGAVNSGIDNYSGSVFHVGAKSLSVNDSVTFAAGSTFSTELLSPDQFGSLRAQILQVQDGTLLNVNVDAHDFYSLQDFETSSYLIAQSVDKDQSEVVAISNDNISINSAQGNQAGLLTVTTSSQNGNLILNVEKEEDTTDYSTDDSAVVDAIHSIGKDSSGKLLKVQNDLIFSGMNSQELGSLTPKSGFATSRESLHIADAVFGTIYSRINSYRTSQVIGHVKRYKTVDSLGTEVTEADDSSTAQSSLIYGNDFEYLTEKDLSKNVWVQFIGSKAKQKDGGGFDGYNAKLQGLVFGFDKKFNKKVLVGTSFAIADSRIDASDNLSTTKSDIYQLSAYLEQEFGKNSYYNLIASASKSVNNSSRSMPVASATAKSKFNSYNYTLKGSLYNKILFDNGLDLVPELGARYSINQVDDYQEEGADTLNLNVKTSDLQMFSGIVAVTAGFKHKIYSMDLFFTKTGPVIIYPKIKLAYEYDFIQDIQTSVNNFQGHDLTFTTHSTRTDPSTLRLIVGSEIFGSDDLSFSIKYIQERRNAYISHSGILETRLAF